jgi:hypothetical protein
MIKFGVFAKTLEEAWFKAHNEAKLFFGESRVHSVRFLGGTKEDDDAYYCTFAADLVNDADAVSEYYPTGRPSSPPPFEPLTTPLPLLEATAIIGPTTEEREVLRVSYTTE